MFYLATTAPCNWVPEPLFSFILNRVGDDGYLFLIYSFFSDRILDDTDDNRNDTTGCRKLAEDTTNQQERWLVVVVVVEDPWEQLKWLAQELFQQVVLGG